MQVGDLLVQFGDAEIVSIDVLHKLLTAERIGVPSTLTILRGTEKLALTIVPAESRGGK